MTTGPLDGIVPAVCTPFDAHGEPLVETLLAHCAALLAEGCGGINLLGTSGEASSLSVAQRVRVMRAVAASDVPQGKMTVGTGAAAVADAIALTREAAALGFGGALLLPPFYFKNVPQDGVIAYVDRVAEETADSPILLYLYHFPAMSAVPFEVESVATLAGRLGTRLAGVKDSSNDLAYEQALAAAVPHLDIFPSDEQRLMAAKAEGFAGIISGSANVTAPFCAAAWGGGDVAAAATSANLRKAFDGLPLVPAIKHVLADRQGLPDWRRTLPPLVTLGEPDAKTLCDRLADTPLAISMDVAAE